MDFQSLNLKPEIMKAIEGLGYKEPSEIQATAIPKMLNTERDFVGQAQTGTGKTAAFVIPLLQLLNTEEKAKNVQALILAPTRELANQVFEEVQKLGKHLNVTSLAIYGGTAYDKQISGLRRNPNIVIGTPGRVIDLINKGKLKLENTRHFILDEADEMLNMGFLEPVQEILGHLKSDRTMWMFSATMSKSILNLINKEFKNPEVVTVKKKTMSNSDIDQQYYVVNRNAHKDALIRLIEATPEIYGVIFCRTKNDTKTLGDELLANGIKCDTLHGDMNQSGRELAMSRMKSKRIQLLVCTDVAARGIDLDNLTHVINMGPSQDLESYVHRIGRTGRAGMKGTAITLVDARDKYFIKRLESFTKSKMSLKELPKAAELKSASITREFESLQGIISAVVEKGEDFRIDSSFESYSNLFEDISKDDLLKIMFTRTFNKMHKRFEELDAKFAKKSKSSSGRGAGRGDRGDRSDRGERRSRGGRNERSARGDRSERRSRSDRFDRSDRGERSEGGERRGRGRFSARTGNVRLFVNKGKKDGLALNGLLDDLSKQMGINKSDIQNVDLKENFSFIEVPEKVGPKVLKENNYKINSKSVRMEISN